MPTLPPAKPAPRTERTEFNGAPAWIKRPEVTRRSIFALIHRLLVPVMPKVLRPTGATGGMAALVQEAARLRHFADNGLPVPAVLALNEDSLILSDTGQQLRAVLRRTPDIATRLTLMQRAVTTLAKIHVVGLCHGRPFLKDMTIDERGTLHVLDLEENPTDHMSLADAQARDVWLLLCSCTEFCEDPLADLNNLLARYLQTTPTDTTVTLRRLGRSLRPFRRMIALLRLTSLAHDTRGAYWSIRVLEDL